MRASPLRALFAAVAALGALSLWAGFGASRVQADDGGAKLVATSVCEAHELKARQAADPTPPDRDPAGVRVAVAEPLGLSLPRGRVGSEHARVRSSRSRSATSTTRASTRSIASTATPARIARPSAGVPSVELCMGCHSQFPPTYDELAGIRTLKEHWEKQEPIEWEQIYRLPEYVQFQHRAHIMKGFDCQTCHGASRADGQGLRSRPTPSGGRGCCPPQTLEMGWCIDCHRQNGATQDCNACHY